MLSAGSISYDIIGRSGLCRTSTENRPSIAATDKRPLHSVSVALPSVNTSIEYRDPTRPSRNTPVTSLKYARDSGYLGIDILLKPPAYGMRIDPAPSQPSILASGRLCPRLGDCAQGAILAGCDTLCYGHGYSCLPLRPDWALSMALSRANLLCLPQVPSCAETPPSASPWLSRRSLYTEYSTLEYIVHVTTYTGHGSISRPTKPLTTMRAHSGPPTRGKSAPGLHARMEPPPGARAPGRP